MRKTPNKVGPVFPLRLRQCHGGLGTAAADRWAAPGLARTILHHKTQGIVCSRPRRSPGSTQTDEDRAAAERFHSILRSPPPATQLGLPRLLPRFGRLSRRLIGQAQSAQPCDLFLRSPSLLFIFGASAGTVPRLLSLFKCGFSPGAGVVRIHAHLRWSTDRQLQLVRVQGCESADILPPDVLKQEKFHCGAGFSSGWLMGRPRGGRSGSSPPVDHLGDPRRHFRINRRRYGAQPFSRRVILSS